MFGAILHITGDRGVLAMAALFLAAFMLAYQLMGANRYWMHTLVKNEE